MKVKIKRKKAVEKPAEPVLQVVDGGQVKGYVWSPYKDGITQGLIANFMMCPQKAHLSNREGLRSNVKSSAIAFGSLVHDALDKIYSAVMRKSKASIGTEWDRDVFVKAQLDIVLREMEETQRATLTESGKADDTALQELETQYGMARGVLPGYLEKWTEDFREVEWLGLEEIFTLMFDTGLDLGKGPLIPLTGKRDGRFRSISTKKLYLFETKTKGRIDETAVADKLNIDLQVLLYCYTMWKEFNELPSGVVYNIIRRPQLQRKKGESLKEFIERIEQDTRTRPEFYYIRYSLSLLKKDLEKFEEELKSALQQIQRWFHGEFHYKNSLACSFGGINCEFLPVCSRNDRVNFKQKETPFPELTAEGSTD